MNFKAFVLAVLVAIVCASDIDDLFVRFMNQYGRTYKNHDEMMMRKKIFASNVAFIRKHNSDPTATSRCAVNQFADLTQDEYRGVYLSSFQNERNKDGTTKDQFKHAGGLKQAPIPKNATIESLGLPTTVDWEMDGGVSPVRTMGTGCPGGSYAFAAAGSVQGAVFVAAQVLPFVSVQQILDCSTAEGNAQCAGGNFVNSFQWVIDNNGVCSWFDYTYAGMNGTCHGGCDPYAFITDYVEVTAYTQLALETAIATVPTAVVVDASSNEFRFYSSGIISTSTCGTNPSLGLLAMGYGVTSTGMTYYRLQNVWGTGWGEGGYVRLARGSYFNPYGECGVQTAPVYAEYSSIDAKKIRERVRNDVFGGK